MEYYERRLPHWQPEGRALFLTFRLYGSLPASVAIVKPNATAGERFAALDHQFDTSTLGPLWLNRCDIAQSVVDEMHSCESGLKLYEMAAYVLMGNHVHLLIYPKVELATLTHILKGRTARVANQLLGRIGKRFWQSESYDHWVRSDEAFSRIVDYIEYNPVKAGFVKLPEEWRWSSAYERHRPSACAGAG
jgi:putative transposase